jgi:hypothetical protein
MALMRPAAKDPFIGAAERANAPFDMPNQPGGDARLLSARAPAHRTLPANPRQGSVQF